MIYAPARLALVVLALFASACSGSTADSDGDSKPARDPSPLDYVKLAKGPCFGACPVFELTLYGDGRVEFFGQRFTKVEGSMRDQASVSRFTSVIEALEERGFASLAPDYSGKACTAQATDHPSVTIERRQGDERKTVRWDTGCRGNDDLFRLEQLVRDLDWLMEVDTYVGTDAERAARRKPR